MWAIARAHSRVFGAAAKARFSKPILQPVHISFPRAQAASPKTRSQFSGNHLITPMQKTTGLVTTTASIMPVSMFFTLAQEINPWADLKRQRGLQFVKCHRQTVSGIRCQVSGVRCKVVVVKVESS